MKVFIKMISFISYWFFFWFILFILGIVKANPLFFILISFIFILSQILYLYIKKTSIYNLTKYIIINLIIKIIPLIILILFYPISFNYNDISFGIFILIIYGAVMILFKINPLTSYNRIINNYIDNDNNNNTEVSKAYDYLYNQLKNNINDKKICLK